MVYRKAIAAVTALLWIIADDVTAQGAACRPPQRPNIVYILADDLGYGDLGCYNAAAKIPTPNLDRLAAEGIRFTDAHAPSSVCTPTRYAILTGRYCWRSRLSRGVLGPWGETLIGPDRLTVPALLKEHGYATACIGKWHLGWQWPTRDGRPPQTGPDRLSNVDFSKPIAAGPTTRGFDYYFGTDVPNYPPYCFIENDRTVGIPGVPNRPEFNRPGPMLPGWQWVEIMPELTRRAENYVENSAKGPARKPFFLYFPLTAPHYPVVPAPQFKGTSRAGDYGDFVAQVDWTVGRVLEAIRRAGIADNTLVIFTSDNGPEVTGEVNPGCYDRIRRYRHYSMGELRGAKRDTWEGGHRVPFVARWPGKIPSGSVSRETVSHVDLMATVAAILGAKLPESAGEDSYNVLPALLGDSRDRPIREATVHHGGSGHLAIRKGDWVLIDHPTGDDNREPEWLKLQRGYVPHRQPGELFDLRQDLAERRNLYGERPEIVAELKALLEKYRRDGRSTPGAARKNDPPVPEPKPAGSEDLCQRVFSLGHTASVYSVALSGDGRLALSGSADNTVRVWDLSGLPTITPLSHRGRGAGGEGAERYTNAKVLLVGESGVGKTGLAWRLTEDRFVPSISTDGVESKRTDWAEQRALPHAGHAQGTEREIWLWDFAGQAGGEVLFGGAAGRAPDVRRPRPLPAQASRGGKKPVKQIVFEGEPLTAISLRRIRDEMLTPPG